MHDDIPEETTEDIADSVTEDIPTVSVEMAPAKSVSFVKDGMLYMEAMYTRVTFDRNGRKIVTPLAELPPEDRCIAVRTFPPNVVPAQVSVGRAMTLSMGNYESAKVSGTITLPCVLEELHGAAYDGWNILDKGLREKVQALVEHRVKKGD